MIPPLALASLGELLGRRRRRRHRRHLVPIVPICLFPRHNTTPKIQKVPFMGKKALRGGHQAKSTFI